MLTVLPLATFLFAGCKQDDVTWLQFNADQQYLEVGVLPVGEPETEAVSLDMLSSLGQTLVGTAVVDPGSGPVGTWHLVTVNVFDEFELQVQRVTVVLASEPVSDLDGDGEPDSRSDDEYELIHDSADLGAWARSFESHGDDDERRTDVFTFFLWQPEILNEATQ